MTQPLLLILNPFFSAFPMENKLTNKPGTNFTSVNTKVPEVPPPFGWPPLFSCPFWLPSMIYHFQFDWRSVSLNIKHVAVIIGQMA
jgi:hypothetical protein